MNRQAAITKAAQRSELLAQDLIALRNNANADNDVDPALFLLTSDLLERAQKIHATLNYLDQLAGLNGCQHKTKQ